MRWSDEIGIETPEQIEVQFEIAGLGSRFAAQVIDWILKFGAIALVFIAIGTVAIFLNLHAPDPTAIKMLAALGIAVFYFFLLGFDIYFEARHNGQTPGKKVAGIRVVRQGGGAADLRSVCIRNLLSIADFLPGYYILGAVLILLTPRSQRLGDLAAGTIVIRERALTVPVEIEEDVERLATDEFVFTAEQLRTCTAEDRQLLRSFLQRYDEMDRRPRRYLALRLADSYLRKTDFRPVEPIDDARSAQSFLASLYRDLEELARHGGY